jgi:hypothetical protein
MTDEQRMAIIRAYCLTEPGQDMPVPDGATEADAAIFAAHLEEIRYGEGMWR